MQKHLIIFPTALLLWAGFALLHSCSRDQTQPQVIMICDSLHTATYALDVQPIFEQYCVECHNPQLMEDNIDLSTYQLAKENTINKNVICSMKFSAGCVPMPYLAKSKLPDSLIFKVECWAQNGYVN